MSSLIAEVQRKHVVLLVHGYNSSLRDVCSAYNRIMGLFHEADLPGECFVGYAWPGGDKFFHYWSVRRRVRQVSSRLAELLGILSLRAASVDIVAHSLGCLVTLRAMQIRGLLYFRNLYLMAAAVRNHMLSDGVYFSGAVSHCSGVYIFKSRNDMVLCHGFPIGESGAEPLGYTGPVPFDTVVSNSMTVDCSGMPDPIRHESYSRRAEIYRFIAVHQKPVTSAMDVDL